MRSRYFFVFSLLLVLGTSLFGQTTIRDLNEALNSGDLTLTANGNGSSSGYSVDGYLRNNTSREIRVNVIINDGLYLVNSGAGQNMAAIQIYESDLSFYPSSGGGHIRIPQNGRLEISFRAFCTDFDKSNPKETESFMATSVLSDLRVIMSRISRYMADNFDNDDGLDIPVQLALWRTQGLTRTRIAGMFRFSDYDWDIASRIMNY